MADPDDGQPPSLEEELFAMTSAADEPPRRRRLTWAPAGELGCLHIALTTAGFVTFTLVNAVMVYAPFRMGADRPNLLPQLVTLLLLAFGLGGLLVRQVGGKWRPYGIGLMLGWVFMTLVSCGLLTGIRA